MMEIKINGKSYFGEKDPCYIVMDAAANHNGKLETAKELIKVTAKMGANAIKFQTYTAEGYIFNYLILIASTLILK